MKLIQFRHGDVFLQQVEKLPSNSLKKASKTVAEGEATGHAHTLVGDARLYERDGKLYVSTGPKQASLVHQEHAKIDLPKNSRFEVIQQREWSPQGDRRVVD